MKHEKNIIYCLLILNDHINILMLYKAIIWISWG